MKTKLAINGACGRMGQRLVALSHEDSVFELVAAIDARQSPGFGKDAGEVAGIGPVGVLIGEKLDLNTKPDVVIDFSTPDGSLAITRECVARKIPIVIATTGFSDAQRDEIATAAHETAVLISPNFSLVVNLLFKLVTVAGKSLAGKGFDVEIVERHHRFKHDSPSGTAMHFAHLIAQEMGLSHYVHGREGLVGQRRDDEIGIHAVRAGDNVGEHTIIYSALGETMELVHKGTSRDSYARGALLAAKFLANRPAGRYSMNDVLGL
ncbi:MAG: 4-hydroxy-tetrahydrodipicolinate reductase [Zavarzinella sp.]